LKVVIACGGTGGHLFPGIAVAEALRRRGHQPLLLISEKKVDAEASAKYGDLRFEVIPAIAKPPTFSPRMLPFLWRLWRTVARCRRLLKSEGADAVLGMGGFTSLPPVYSGHKLGLPTFIHDSNAVPGRSNVMTSKFCSKVLLGLEAARSFFPRRECEVVGTPVREELREAGGKAAAREHFGLVADKFTVLVMGGSQGAKGLNTLVCEAAEILGDRCQFLHLAGKLDHERVSKLVAGRPRHHVLAFCSEMAEAYAAADVGICRSGASSLTEMAFLGLPGLLVPYPFAADDHQTANARAFVEAGAAEMVQEADLNGEKLAGMVEALIDDEDRRATMAAAMRSLSVDEAADRIAGVVESQCRL
jgi:UDP-N-acetylglucosamine--N-acetylmuramyl-(pentapeptide) pyrophosphoryl-undecaprenol N-acetylglucosamine transferase